MHWKPGDKVAFLNEKGGGVIAKIEGFKIFVLDETGFERSFRSDEICIVHSSNYDGIDPELAQKILEEKENLNHKNFSKKVGRTGVLKPIDVWEIDLHIEEILDSHLGMSNTEILQRQLSILRSLYNQAINKHIRRLIIIHGVGEGVLKTEVRLFLQGKEGVEYFDADYKEYGKGATQVEIRYMS